MQRMAHGWNSCFQDLPSLSSDPRTLTRTTTEPEGGLSQQLENFIGNHDFTDAVDSQDASATNCYSKASIGNSSSDGVYQRLYRETLWQGDGQQMEKDDSPTRENSDISDFTTDLGLSTTGSTASSFATNLQGLKQDCGMLAASFLEDFSDNYSQSNENMTVDGGEDYPDDNKEKQLTAADPNIITTFSNEKENLKDEKVLKERTEPLKQENVGTDHLDSTDDQDKTVQQDKDDKSLKRKRKSSGSSDAETVDEQNAPNSNCTNVQDENEEKDMCLNTPTSDPTGTKVSDLKDATNDLIESTSSNNSHDAEPCLQSAEDQPHENVGQDDICRNLAVISDIVSHIDNPSDKEEHNIEKDQTGTAEEMNNTSSDPNCSGSGVSGDSLSIDISDQSKQSGDQSTDIKPGLEKELTDPAEGINITSSADPDRSSAAATSDRDEQSVSSPKETSLQPNTSSTDTNLCLRKEVTSPSEMKSTTSATDPECSGLEDTSDKNEKSVGGCPDSSSQPDSTSKIKLEKEQTNPAEQTNTSSPRCGDPAVTSDNNELCVGSALDSSEPSLETDISSTDVKSPKKESTSPPEKTMANSSLDQSSETLDPQSLTEDVDERTGDSSEQFDTAEEQLVPDTPYGEPLSGEDSSSEVDETKLEGSACKETSDGNSIDLSDGQTPQLKSSGQMRKHLQPVVLLKTSESVSELSSSYHCGVCQHMTNNVDDLIGHHHHCHLVHNFQFCKTCNLYLVGSDEAKKHLCNVKKQNPLSSNSTKLKRKKRHGPYKCVKCKITFSKVVHHIRHMRTHTGKTPFLCKECGVYFAQAGTLKRHKRIPGRCKPGKSQVPNTDAVPCEPQTPPQEDPEPKKPHENLPKCYVQLVDISTTHLCSLCDRGFLTVKKAKKHFYSLHKNKHLAVSLTKCTTKVSVENTQSVDDNFGEKYQCPLCPRVFKYSYNRARHLRDCVRNAVSSSQDKAGKYRCPLCKGYFTLASNRYRHIKTFCLKDCLNRLAKERAEVRQQDVTKIKTKVTDVKKQPKANEEKTPSKEIVVKKQQLPPPPQTPPPPPPPPNVTALKGAPRYRCTLCPAVFYHASGKYRHMKKHELFKLTGKMFKYRNSLLSTVSKPATLNSKKTEESKDDLKPTEDKNSPSLKCRFCEKCFSSLEVLNKHVRNHRGERPYRCLECGKGFKKHCHMVTHKSVHQRRIQCTVCRKILPTIGELIQHRNSHLKRGDLKCPDCPQQFKFPAHLLRHLDSHKNKQKKATEPEETRPSKPQGPLESVKEESQPKHIQCSLCKEVFDDLQVLRKHCLTHISASNQCPFCKRSFTHRRYLLRHMIRHTGDKPFSCTNCGKQFYRDLYLKLHRERCVQSQTSHVDPGETNSKNKRPYWCLYCPRTFSKKIRLKNHHRGHKTNSLIQCVKCGQYYGGRKVNHHEKNCDGSTGLDIASLKVEDSKNTSQTTKCVQTLPSLPNAAKMLQFKCSHCPQKFRYRSLLFRHLVSHTGVQPYGCMHCGHRFRTQSMCLQHEAFCNGVFKDKASNVNSDVATNLSDMPTLREAGQKQTSDSKSEYKCTFCTKTFMKARNLRRHILTHNEVKPYRCKACDSCFSRYDHLKVHQGRCKGRRTRLEVCIPKISLDDVGKGWQNKYNFTTTEKQEIFTCEVCSRTFPTASKLSRHNTMYHTVKLFKCTRCGSSFSHEKTLKQHRKSNRCRRLSTVTHAPLPLETNPPAKNVPEPHITAKQQILQRIRPCFNKKYQYICSYCPRIFGNSWQLGVHTRLHTGERPYSCEYCGESFIRKDYVKRHHAKCTEKEQQPQVLCERCGGFFSKHKIEYHKRNCPAAMANASKAPTCQSKQSASQSPPKGFSCAYCSSRFLLFSQLQEHFLNAHKLETMVPPASTIPLQHHLSNMPRIKEEPVDEVCDKQPSGANLICKLDTALNREIICPECNMTFANRAGLSAHLRTHATERPYNCKICKKGFWNRNIFRNHEKKCRSTLDSEKKTQEGPLKAELNFALTDSVLLFKDNSIESGSGVLQTNFSCQDELTEVSVQNSSGDQVQSNSTKEKKAVQYQCSECEESFTDGLLLISHLEDHGRQEQEKKRNTCFKCGQVCSSQAKLEKHMRVHGPAQKYNCPDCSKTVDSLADLEVHRTFHDPNRRFVCKLCNQRFCTRSSLYNHYEEDHPADAYFCRFCNKSYSVKKSLSRHNRKCHQKEMKEFASTLPTLQDKSSTEQQQPSSHVSTAGESDDDENNVTGDSDSDSAPYFPCHVCTKTFPTSESLEDHQRCHLGEKPHECGECGRCFFQASQLQQHQRMHKSEFQCQTCGRGFVSLFALRKHKHSHGKSRPYRCPKCHISFTGHSQLAEHMMTHREENFPCDICNRVFISKSSRAEHRKCHSKLVNRPLVSVLRPEPEKSPSLSDNSLVLHKELKYRCGVCNERFRDPEELSEHGCMAVKERPYSCLDCDKHFLHASHLKKHRNTHQPSQSTGKYPCGQCSNSFLSAQNFLSHLKTHVETTAEIVLSSDTNEGGLSRSFICPICHQCLPSATELIGHFPTHLDGTFECKICKGTFPSRSKLEEHENCHLTSAAEFECTRCGQAFLGNDAFCHHSCSPQQQIRPESKYSKPSVQISPPGHYPAAGHTEEINVTGEEMYSCPHCTLQFSSKISFLEHQNKEHMKAKPFKCDLCGKKFARRRYLREHQRRHRLKLSISSAAENKLTCSQCATEFETSQDLSLHMRLHAEKEGGTYRCDMCYKSFGHLALLKKHQESHVGEVVYECTECDKAFAFPHLLEEHQQTHAGSSQS